MRIVGELAGFVAAVAAAMAVAIYVNGPLRMGTEHVFVRAGSSARAGGIAAVALGVALALSWLGSAPMDRLAGSARALFRVTCAAVTLAAGVLVFSSLVTACGGLDSAGYLGAAQLLTKAHLTEEVAIARLLPVARPVLAAAPLGWVPAASPFHIAPEFPLGLPMVMAAFWLAAGRTAPFYVAPLLGAGAAVLVCLTARRFLGELAAAIAGVLVVLSPVFIDMSLQPMSDVPATFWTVLAAYALWRPEPRPATGGIAAGLAILTRPPLAIAVAALAFGAPWRGRRSAAAFGAIVLGFLAALMALQWHMYGNPAESGHGSAAALFTLAAFPHDASAHARWLVDVHTPVFLVALIAGAARNSRFALRAIAVFAAVAAPYLFYAVRFDDWEMLRFLLPGLPFLYAVAASSIGWLRPQDHAVRAHLTATILIIAVAVGSFTFVTRHRVLELWRQESRYPLVGRWFEAHTGPRSVALASLHSGSVKYYTGRPVVRIDLVPDDRLFDVTQALERSGYEPYLVLEQGSELEQFYGRFGRHALDRLRLDPLARLEGVNVIRLSVQGSR